MICAYSPQAKGRVERTNGTLQDRLVKEMRLLNICDYERGREYLPEFIADYNRRFAVVPVSDIGFHRPLDETLDLNFLFSIHDFRKITKTLQINYAGKTYQIITKHPAYFYAKQEVLITVDSAGSISVRFNGNLLTIEEIEKRPKQGAVVSVKSENNEPLPPAYDHPWRTYGKKHKWQTNIDNVSSRTGRF
mgnify:CR=1 FL=1